MRYARNSLSDIMENDALAVEIFGDFLVKFKEEREVRRRARNALYHRYTILTRRSAPRRKLGTAHHGLLLEPFLPQVK